MAPPEDGVEGAKAPEVLGTDAPGVGGLLEPEGPAAALVAGLGVRGGCSCQVTGRECDESQ